MFKYTKTGEPTLAYMAYMSYKHVGFLGFIKAGLRFLGVNK